MEMKDIALRNPTVGALTKLRRERLRAVADGDKRAFSLCRAASFRIPEHRSQSVKPRLHYFPFFPISTYRLGYRR
jgi:hypothetical protein